MEEAWHCLTIDFEFSLALLDLFGKVTDAVVVFFFVDHVETSNELSESLIFRGCSLHNMAQHLLNMRLSNNLQPSENQFELEMWCLNLQFINDSSNKFELLNE